MSIMSQEAKKQAGCVLHWTGAVASANSPKAITSNGDTKQLLPFPGAGIGMFDGTGDYLSIPNNVAFDFSGGGNYTFEFYISFADLTLRRNILSKYTDDSNLWQVYWHPTNGIGFAAQVSGSWVFTFDQGAVTGWVVNTLYHIAVVHSGTTYTIYRDGVSVATTTDVDNIPYLSGSPLYIGTGPFESAGTPYYKLNGNLSELRVSNVARYTANFTPPRRQLESDSNTKLLLHFNRNDATFIDSSPSNHAITAYGNAKQLCSPCGSGVAYFDGSGDCLTVADGDWIHSLTSPHTIEIMVKISSNTTNQTFFNIGGTGTTWSDSNGHFISCHMEASNLYYQTHLPSNKLNSVSIASTNIPTNQWVHLAFVYTGAYKYIFINGALSASIACTNITMPTIHSTAYIARHTTLTTFYLNGNMSEFCISSVARYTAPFTPQITPFTPDPYTKLLLHMDGVGNAFYDSSDPPGDNGFPILPDGVTITPNGTFTTQKMKDGRNIWKFDGSTNYIAISDHASWSMFLNDFTIAGWVKFDSIAANKVIIGQYTDANNQWYLQWTTGNIIQLYGITSSTARFDFSCPLAAVANTWYHIVVQRSGSSCIMYINGVAQTVTQTTAFSATATDIAAVLSIGKINTGYQTGNIKDLQMFTKALTMDQISALYQETFIY